MGPWHQLLTTAGFRSEKADAILDNALDLENDIIIALCNRSDSALYADIHIRFETSSRTLVETGEYMLSSINFEVLHYLPLQ